MLKLLSFSILAFAAASVHAGEIRGLLQYGIGSETLEDDANDELSGDVSGIGIGLNYFLEESGPFFGIGYASLEVGDFEVNGSPLGIPDEDVNVTSFWVGYRGGTHGEPQFYVQAGINRTDTDGGDDDDDTEFRAGVERTSQTGRYDLSVGYSTGDDFDTFGADAAWTFFVNETLGASVGAGYTTGDGEIFGENVDTSGWSLRAGIELRVFQ